MQKKVILLGDTNSGKTSFVHRFITDEFLTEVKPTSGCHFQTKEYAPEGKETTTYQIYDLGGIPDPELLEMYAKGAVAKICFFDVSNVAAFEMLKYYIQIVDGLLEVPMNTIIIANQMDKLENGQFKVPKEEIEKFAEKKNAKLFFCSAKDPQQFPITPVFDHVADLKVQHYEEE